MGVFLVLTMLVGTMTAAFAETSQESGIKVSLETDKDSYEKGEKVSIKVVVENTTGESVDNVVAKLDIPEGIELAEGTEATIAIGTIKAGENSTKTVVATATEEIKGDDIIINDDSENTGDNVFFMVKLLVAALIAAGVVVVLIKKKNVKAAGIVATVAVGVIGVLATISVAYAAIGSGSVKASKIIKYDGVEKEISVIVTYGVKDQNAGADAGSGSDTDAGPGSDTDAGSGSGSDSGSDSGTGSGTGSGAVVDVTADYDRVSVHDPSIIKDTKTGVYYIFGSHMAWAKSTDLINWTAFTNNINRDYKTIFAAEAAWAGKAQSNYDISGNLWAPDVIWNEDMGKWCMYMSINGNDWNSTISLLTADSLDGDWTYVGPVIQSGMSKGYGVTFDYTKVTGETTVNSRYTSYVRGSVPTYEPHAIDPCVTYDEEGNLWMSYGSWSGGIGMIQLDKETGLRDYDVKYELDEKNLTDPYTGYKIAGGNQKSGEASYIEKIRDYYYLFLSYGGLVANGGYSMRVFRSEKITGPYVDESGEYARYKLNDNVIGSTGAGNTNGTVGIKLMTYYKWSFSKYAQVAQGHNSAFIDEDGKAYVVYHTRTNDGTEGHTVKVHQLFVNEDGWIVAAPFEYTGETLKDSGYKAEEVAGTYEVLNHKSSINYAGLEYVKPEEVKLNADGTVSGAYTGTWSVADNSAYVKLTLNNVEYNGVLVEQYMEETKHKTLCFTLLGDNGVCVWGSKYLSGKDAVDMTLEMGAVKFPTSTIGDINFDTEGLYGTTVSYDSQNKSVIANNGKVTPAAESTDVVIKATITNGDYSIVKEFTVTVLGSGAEDGRILVGSYAVNSPLDLSKAEEGTYQFQNPFNKSVTEGLEIYNGVSIEFDVEGTGSYLSNILSFYGSGRLYFTGGSYLGYNATGGYYDANVTTGTAWAAGTDYLKGKAHVEIKIENGSFEVYINDQLAYTFKDVLDGKVAGGTNMTSCASVLTWLNNTAETINFGWGSWWSDKFNGTISNVKLYANPVEKIDTSAYEYYQDFSKADMSEWVSTNAQNCILLGNDGGTHGNYIKFAPGQQNSRGAQYSFNLSKDITGEYTVEFDTMLKAGDNQTTGFGLTCKDLAYNSKNMNNGAASGYIFYMTAYKGTEWTIANADEGNNKVEIPTDAWVNVKAEVNTNKGTADLVIKKEDGTVLYTGTVTINGAGSLGGIYVLGGRYHSESSVDSVKVTSSVSKEMSVDGFEVLAKYDKVESKEILLKTVPVSEETGLSVSFEFAAGAASDWDTNVANFDWSYQQGTMLATYTTDAWATRTNFYPGDGVFTDAGTAFMNENSLFPHQIFLGTTSRMTISYNPDNTVDYYLNGVHMFSYTEEKNPGIAAFIEGMINSASANGLRFAVSVNNVVLGYSIDYSTK